MASDTISPSTAIGAATVLSQVKSTDKILYEADLALYQTKNASRNKVIANL